MITRTARIRCLLASVALIYNAAPVGAETLREALVKAYTTNPIITGQLSREEIKKGREQVQKDRQQLQKDDWQALHEQAVSDIVVAHSWFRTLSGLDYASGFSAERILLEYEVALNTVILGEQAELTEPVREAITSILGIDASSLQVINRPPTRSKPIYMKVWEARKADGLDYDPDDERQQAFLSEITKYNIRSIE